MSDSLTANGHEALEEKLNRLSRKPSVKACIVIDRATGSILKTSGETSTLRTSKSSQADASAATSALASDVPAEETESRGLEDFAAMIWNYVNVSGQLVQDLDAEDEMKLLRLRTKKQEIVIVPDVKYLLTVIHDTPPV